ncbi:MAG: efflux RND transporter periplasmic adaptor subunit [Coraliomargarita sp.]
MKSYATVRWAGVALLASSFMIGCSKQQEVAAPPPPPVTVDIPELREVEVFRTFPSTLKGIDEVEIRARVSGYLEETKFNEGSIVKQGDHLFTIEQEPYKLAVEAAQADLERAEAGRELAETQLRRLDEALKSNAVSESEVDIAAAELAQSIALVSQAKANLNNALLDLSYTDVHAPINGRVSLALVSNENLVGYQEPTVITTIVDDSRIEAHFEVPEREIIRFMKKRGEQEMNEDAAKIEIQLELADRSLYSGVGKLDFLDNRVDSMTRTIRARAVFDNPDHELASGMFATVKIPTAPNQEDRSQKEALLVPADVILRDIGGRYVWVVDDQNVVHRRGVVVGDTVVKAAEGDQPAMRQTIILEGLEADERVIVLGLQRARDGANVTPTAL